MNTADTAGASPHLARRLANSKRVTVLLAVVMFAAIVALAYYAIVNSNLRIRYDKDYPPATPSELCPGEKFTYPVHISVPDGNTVSSITENWCRASDGICPDAYDVVKDPKGSMDAREINASATRWVPETMPPGEWQLIHCNHNVKDGDPRPNVSCYGVDITVKECKLP